MCISETPQCFLCPAPVVYARVRLISMACIVLCTLMHAYCVLREERFEDSCTQTFGWMEWAFSSFRVDNRVMCSVIFIRTFINYYYVIIYFVFILCKKILIGIILPTRLIKCYRTRHARIENTYFLSNIKQNSWNYLQHVDGHTHWTRKITSKTPIRAKSCI